MKRISILLFTIFIFLFSPMNILALEKTNKSDIPFEIYSITTTKDSLVIKGWGILTQQQHFNSTSSHSYQLELVSDKNHKLSFKATPEKNDQTNNMKYIGVPMCGANALNMPYQTCNYSFTYSGFTFKVPFNQLKKGHSYSASLVISANKTKVTKKTPLFYPILTPISKTISTTEYKINASLYDTTIQVSTDTSFELKEPVKGSYRNDKVYCSGYGYPRFYTYKSNYKNIYDRYFNGSITFYKVKTKKLSTCKNGRNYVVEGNDYTSWIIGNFVDYSGESLHIDVLDRNEAPILTIMEHPTIEVGTSIDLLTKVSAYDKEDGDITHKIIQDTVLDNQKLGSQEIRFTVSDSEGKSTTAVMIVTVVKGNVPPVIYAENQTIYQYDSFYPMDNVNAVDEEDGNLKHKLTYSGLVDTHTLGNYPITYSVIDSKGARSEKTIQIQVIRNPREKIRYIARKQSKLFYRETIPLNWKNKIQFLIEQLEEPKNFAQSNFKK